MLSQAMLGGEDIGYGFRRDLKLISEVQAPFRGVRRFFYVAFSAAAGISTFFTVPRLVRGIQGGEGAPDIWETAGNAAINIGGNGTNKFSCLKKIFRRFYWNFNYIASPSSSFSKHLVNVVNISVINLIIYILVNMCSMVFFQWVFISEVGKWQLTQSNIELK